MVPESYDNVMTGADIYIGPVGTSVHCKTSDLVLHELLHSFGIEHDSSRLMSDIGLGGTCTQQRMTEEHITFLKDIYG